MNKNLPLCVDLDGTLILTDSLLESFLLLIHKNILYLFLMPIWLCRGKIYFKQAIAQRVSIDPTTLPYHPELLAYLKTEHQRHRKIILASATYHTIAEKIAAHLGIFSQVMATDANCNMKGATKAKHMVEKFGEKQFVYAGNEYCDLAVWKYAAAAIVVTASPGLIKKAEKCTKIEQVFKAPALSMEKLGKALRMHQWVKNILIFIPLLAAHKLFEVLPLLHAVLAFLAFSTLASATYIMNDLLDLESDRNHPRKKQRMFASGQLSILTGVGIMMVLLAITAGLATLLPLGFAIVLLCYAMITLAYSLFIKQWVLCDVMALAMLYTLRIIAGTQAIDVVHSSWLMAFSIFIFISLAFIKRYSELSVAQKRGELVLKSRGYAVEDLPLLVSFGVVSGYLAVLVLAFYIDNPDIMALYQHPEYLWAVCLILLYWVSRLWLITTRDQMHDDPIIFALQDKTSYFVAALIGLTVLLAI